MRLKAAILCLVAVALTGSVYAQGDDGHKGVPHLDHVFVIMMENHGYGQILNNPDAPFINELAKSSGYATNYFAVGHPSSTNYLETVGGSNFGIRSDNYPDWHSGSCTPNIVSLQTATDNPASPLICPIAGTGTDAATPAVDCTNEVQATPPNCYYDLDGTLSIAAAPTVGKTIADQLVAVGKSWKSYQESLPPGGADRVNISDGFFTNNTDFTPYFPGFASWSIQKVSIPAITNQTQAQSDIVYLYAVKHNPFVYFKSVQEGTGANSLANVVGFDGPNGLYADLASGEVPSFSFIAPNQCNDQHGRGNAGPFCNFDAADNGTQTGLNGTEIYRGDVTVQTIVTSIKKSPAWREGRNALVVMWDENDYTATPNHVLTIVDTNYGDKGVTSGHFYTHFSLLKTIEAGFGLPCLNHACDPGVKTMSDLFAQ
ncbi:MAG: alkaline phosphatase family protein [Candidatus Acidiferrum sp.]